MTRIDTPILLKNPTAHGGPGAADKQQGAGFGTTLEKVVQSVSKDQAAADASVEALATGREGNIHTTMIAMEKADISFQLLVQVRNKIISAYETIMRMQV